MAPHLNKSFQGGLQLRRRMKFALLSLTALLVVALSACGAANNVKANNARSHILTVAVSPKGNYSENFNPFLPTGNVNLYGTNGMIFETLYFFNRLNGSTTPMLATSYQFSPDAMNLKLNLRRGVKWNDGRPFTSADVLYTFNLIKTNKSLDASNLWQSINTITAPDAYTVNVTFKTPSQPLVWYLAGQTYIVPKHIWEHVSNPTTYVNDRPVGTGPFMLKSFAPEIYKLQRNPNYWGGKTDVEEIDYPAFYSNTSSELMLARGDLDWNGQFLPNVESSYVARDPQHNHYWFPPQQVTALYLNNAKYPFNLLPVRQAISDAIDREQLGLLAESGYQVPASPTGLVLPGSKAYLAAQYATLAFKVDTNKAQAALAKAGFTRGSDGIYADKHGQKLAFDLMVPTGWTDWNTASQVIQSELGAIGMKVNINSVSVASYFTNLQTGKFDTAIHWTNTGPTPWYLYNALLNSANTAPIGQQAASNWSRWSDPETDKLLNQYARTTDPTIQKNAIYGLQKIMVEQLPAIPLIYGSTWYEYSTARFTGWPDQNHPYAVPAPFVTPDAEIVVLHLKAA